MIQGDWGWCSLIAAALVEDDWRGCGGVRRGGGGGEEEEEAVDEACWELTRAEEDINTPVAGLMMGFLAPVRVPLPLWLRLPRPTPCPLRPRRPLSTNTTCSGSGSEGGEEGCELCNRLASLSP